MLSYLSLYVTNQCFIPKDFFTTFELVRFRTTETGEFIELDDNSRKMIFSFNDELHPITILDLPCHISHKYYVS